MKITAAIFAFLVLAAPAIPTRAAVHVGDQANLTYQTTEGKTVDMSQMHGRILVVDFWATWCGPCMAEASHMVDLNKKYGDKGLQMLGVSLDSDLSRMKEVAKAKGFTWPQYFDGMGWENKLWAKWGERGIPFTVLVDPNGKVVYAGHPAGGLDAAIEQTFKLTPPHLVDPAIVASANKSLDGVEAQLASGDLKGAMKSFGRVDPAAKADPDFAKRLADMGKLFNAAGEKKLAEVQTLISGGNYRQAFAELRDISNEMSGQPVAVKARSKMLELNGQPEVRKALADAEKADRDADRASKAADALAVAQKLLDDHKLAQAYGRFKFVVAQFPGTDAATTAADQVKSLDKEHPEIAREQSESADLAKAKAALGMANAYRESGRTDLARTKYQFIIDHYPATPQAKDAKEALQTLGN